MKQPNNQYTCSECGKTFKKGNTPVACAVLHQGGCCHYGDTEVIPQSKPDNQIDGLGAILENLVRYIERGEHNGRPIHFIGEYKQQIDQYYADFYRDKIPKKKQLEGYESPWGWTIPDEDKDSKQGWNDCVDTITAQFNRGDNDE